MNQELKRIIEALLFVADSPLSPAQLAKLLDTTDLAQVKNALITLVEEYQEMGRAYTLEQVAGGFCFRTRPDLAAWVARLGKQQVARLSPAALETLAIVAYKQPVLRAEIERLRGVDAGGVLRMLMEKDLVRVVGRKDLPGRPLIYGTTRRFLETFGLNDLKDLPSMEEIEAIMGEALAAAGEELQGQLNLESAAENSGEQDSEDGFDGEEDAESGESQAPEQYEEPELTEDGEEEDAAPPQEPEPTEEPAPEAEPEPEPEADQAEGEEDAPGEAPPETKEPV